MTKYEAKVRKWAKKYSITLNPEYTPYASYENETYEDLHNCLFDVGHKSGDNPPMPGVNASPNVYEMEFGTSPVEYFPECIEDVLNLIKEHSDVKNDWQLLDCSSEDEWETVDVSLKNLTDNKVVEFKITDVNNSDWISPDFFGKMQIFTRDNCALTVIPIYVDAFYRMIALPHKAAKKLQKYIHKYSEPY